MDQFKLSNKILAKINPRVTVHLINSHTEINVNDINCYMWTALWLKQPPMSNKYMLSLQLIIWSNISLIPENALHSSLGSSIDYMIMCCKAETN